MFDRKSGANNGSKLHFFKIVGKLNSAQISQSANCLVSQLTSLQLDWPQDGLLANCPWTSDLLAPPTRCASTGDHVFAVAGPWACNSLSA